MHRTKPVDMTQEIWMAARNTQCNLDTVVQAISLRSLPEILTDPLITHITFKKFDKFGYTYADKKGVKVPIWSFEFSVLNTSVFYDGISELGHLYNDCNYVPMICCPTMNFQVSNFLDVSDERRNIYFEVIGHEE